MLTLFMVPALWVIAVLAHVTALQRIHYTWRQTGAKRYQRRIPPGRCGGRAERDRRLPGDAAAEEGIPMNTPAAPSPTMPLTEDQSCFLNIVRFAYLKDIAGDQTGGSGSAIFIGTLLDNVPESIILGMSVALGSAVNLAFLAAVLLVACVASPAAAAYKQAQLLLERLPEEHAYQKALRTFLGTLKAEDFAVEIKPVPLVDIPDAEDQYRLWLLVSS